MITSNCCYIMAMYKSCPAPAAAVEVHAQQPARSRLMAIMCAALLHPPAVCLHVQCMRPVRYRFGLPNTRGLLQVLQSGEAQSAARQLAKWHSTIVMCAATEWVHDAMHLVSPIGMPAVQPTMSLCQRFAYVCH